MTVRNLLLIENDDQHAEQVQQLLQSGDGVEAQQEEFHIHRSTCLNSSLAVLENRPIDVILLDDALPDHSGVDSINAIQANGCRAPIILYTDISDGELALQAVRAGAQDYLVKDRVTANELIHCLLHAIERRQRIVAELNLGEVKEQHSRMGQLQAHLLPQSAPTVSGYQISGRSEPAASAGGDYFDYLELPGGNLGVAIADVSGHEMASSLTMAGLRGCVRTCTRLAQPIDAMMWQANQGVCGDVMPGHFVVAMLAQIDPVADTLQFVTAGHRGYLITEQKSDPGSSRSDQSSLGELIELATGGMPLGLDLDQQYEMSEVMQLRTGDLIVLFTDGIWEAMSPEREQLGLETVLKRIQANRHLRADEIVHLLFEEMRVHCAPGIHDDDAAVVVIKKD